MLKIISGLPQNVLAIEAVGMVTRDDYRNVLVPAADSIIAHAPIKMLYVVGAEFTGFEPGALWADGEFGFKHWHDFSDIAVVTDHAWMRAMIGMFSPFFHGEVRLFRLAELSAAKDWVSSVKRPAAW